MLGYTNRNISFKSQELILYLILQRLSCTKSIVSSSEHHSLKGSYRVGADNSQQNNKRFRNQRLLGTFKGTKLVQHAEEEIKGGYYPVCVNLKDCQMQEEAKASFLNSTPLHQQVEIFKKENRDQGGCLGIRSIKQYKSLLIIVVCLQLLQNSFLSKIIQNYIADTEISR